MSLHSHIHSQGPSSFHYKSWLREGRDMAEAERTLANNASATNRGMAPDGRYVNGRQGIDLQAFQSSYIDLERITPLWENEIPATHPLLRSRIAHSAINLPVDGLGFPQPMRFEDAPVVRVKDRDPFPYTLN